MQIKKKTVSTLSQGAIDKMLILVPVADLKKKMFTKNVPINEMKIKTVVIIDICNFHWVTIFLSA